MTLSLPNLLTLSRVPLLFIVVALLNSEFLWAATAAFWLYIVAALTDWLDGMIARQRGEVSPFGRFMDAVIDKVLVIGLLIALVNNAENFMGHDVVALMLLLGILAREFAIAGMRTAAAAKGVVIEADAGGKLKAFVQFNAIGWLIGARMLARDFPEVFAGDERDWVVGVRAVGMGLYGLSAFLTITSGVAYFRRHGSVVLR